MANTILHIIYDVITKKTIEFYSGTFMKQCKEMGIEYTSISHLYSGRQISVQDRYIDIKNKHLIFTLVDFETEQEYDCINPCSLCIYLNKQYEENQNKYVYELVKERQSIATIYGRPFYKKGKKPTRLRGRINCKDFPKIKEILLKQKLQNKIAGNLRTRFRLALYKQITEKCDRTFKLLGCGIKEFMIFMEKKFKKGMTWDNYGKEWEIDHIESLMFFDLTKAEDQAKACHYTNLQPLWIDEHKEKTKLDNKKYRDLFKYK